jgi:hypothetical protein
MSSMKSAQLADSADCDDFCAVCHCTSEGCDGTVCHGLDAD